MFYSNFQQNCINSNVLQNTYELITQTKRLPQTQLQDFPPGGLFPQNQNYDWWEDDEYEDNLDDASYWATKVLGRRLHKREFAIRTGDMPRDIRIVSSQKEKAYWESAINCTSDNPFGKFKVYLNPDGIHARVGLNPNYPANFICRNCFHVFEESTRTIYDEKGPMFCCSKCECEYKEKIKHSKYDRLMPIVYIS